MTEAIPSVQYQGGLPCCLLTGECKAGLIPSSGHRDWQSAGLQELQSEPAKDCSQPGDEMSDFKVH